MTPEEALERAQAAGLTPLEADAWEAVRLAAKACLTLADAEATHLMEKEEFCHAFHVIQSAIARRPFLRALAEQHAEKPLASSRDIV